MRIATPRQSIDEGTSALSIIHMFQRALAKPTASDGSDGIGHTAVDLHIDDQALALGRLVYPEESAAQHRHPHAQYLAWAEATPVHRNSIDQ